MSTEPVLWYYTQGTERRGPVTDDKLAQLVALGEVTPDTLLWNASLPAWVAARTVFATPPPTPLPGPPALPQPSTIARSSAATAPVSVPVTQPQDQTLVAPVTVKKMSVLLMIVLTVTTFGFYYNIWFLRRRVELNNLLSKRKLGAAPIIVSLFAGAASIILEISFPAADKGVAGVFRLAELGCLLFASFRVADIIDDHCRATGEAPNVRSGLAGDAGVLFFGAFWLQHCINKYLRSAQQTEGGGVPQSSFFPGTMKTPTKVVLGTLAVLGVFFTVFIVVGISSSGSASHSPNSSDTSSSRPQPSLPSAPPLYASKDGVEVYLSSALVRLRYQNQHIDSLKGCGFRGDPGFTVDSTPEGWVIYEINNDQVDRVIQFALERQPEEYYGVGQRMKSDVYYEVTGSAEFTTVLGQQRMVPAGRVAGLDLPHCHES